MDIAFQDTNIEFGELDKIKTALNELNYTKANTFGIIPFTISVTFTNPVEIPTILLGGTKSVKLWLAGHMPENTHMFYDPIKFNQRHYYYELGEDYLLNGGAVFMKWGDVKDEIFTKPIFIKPSSDLKYFSGKVFYPSENTVFSELQATTWFDVDLDDDVDILLNTNLHKINSEYRVFVINNEVIDLCQYIKNGKVVPERVDIHSYSRIVEFVNMIKQIYAPHDHYVVDVALVDDELYVIEYNCLNCSGMYAIDRKKVYQRLLDL